MNPYDERKLIDEVIYLHSLWHQGPPQIPPPNPLPNSIPIPIPTPSFNNNIASASKPYIPEPVGPQLHHGSPCHLYHHRQQQRTNTANPVPTHLFAFAPADTGLLPPASSTTFEKRKKNKNKRSDPANNNNVEQLDPLQRSPDPEWPCPGSRDPMLPSGWSAPKKKSRLESPPVSPQEKERLAGLQSQKKASQAFREFFLDDDDDDDDDHDDDDDGDDCEEFEGFFVRIFMEDDGLMGYYHRCFESGEFCCLVCGAVGKKNSGKKFKDCVGLLQHSMSILRTVKKRAHRAFGQAVCKVLGWDIDRLPTIVMKGEPLGSSVKTKPSEEEEGKAKENADDGKDSSHKPDSEGVSLENNDQLVEDHAQGFVQSISGCSTMEIDVHNKAENFDEKLLDIELDNGESITKDEGESKEKVVDDGKGSSTNKMIKLLFWSPV